MAEKPSNTPREVQQAPPPPARAQEQILKFDHLTSDEFERLCRRLGRGLGEVQGRQYGTPGQAQDGIDVLIRHEDDELTTIQCRRIERLTPAGLRNAVDDFLAGKWANRSRRFIYAATVSFRPTGLAEAALTEHDRLKTNRIEFAVWDTEELSILLKQREDLVDDFWGPTWVQAFCLPAGAEAYLREAEQRVAGQAQPPVLILDTSDAGEGLKKAIAQLREDHPNEVTLVVHLLEGGDQFERASRAAALATAPTEQIEGGSAQVWSVIARVAAKGGQWSEASVAWEKVGDRSKKDPVAAVIQASISADLAQEPERARHLLERAQAADPDHPRVRLELANRLDDAQPRLEALMGLEPDEPEDLSLAAAHRALAYLQLGQIEDAEREIAIVRQHAEGDKTHLRILEINLDVQKGREAMRVGAPVDDAAMLQSEKGALGLREELRSQKRYPESSRLLMMAVDCAVLRFDRARGVELLRSIEPEDPELRRDADRSSIVSSAARAGLWEEVPRLLQGAPDTSEFRCLSATATLAANPTDATAQETLEQQVAADGPEADQAALALLMTAAMRGGAWNAVAEKHLTESYEREAISLKAFHLMNTNSYGKAKKLLKGRKYRDLPWAKRALFDIAVLQGDTRQQDELVPWILESVPDRNDLLTCARSAFRHNDFPTAEARVRRVVEDQQGADRIRAEACWLLMVILNAQDDRWEEAQRIARLWANLFPSDARLGLWQSRIGNRLRNKRRPA